MRGPCASMKLKLDDTPFPKAAKRAKVKASTITSEACEDLDALLQAKKDSRSKRWSPVSGSKNLDFHYLTQVKDPREAYELICVCALFENKNDDTDKDEDEDGDEDAAERNYKNSTKAQPCGNGTACSYGRLGDSPSSRLYAVSKAGFNKHSVAIAMLALRDPDAFDVYTFNDYMAYGALEVVQNLIWDFDEAHKRMDWREAWAVIEGLALFMLLGNGMEFGCTGDGEIAQDAVELIARMVLASLAMLEAESRLGVASGVVNVGWIIGLYLKLAEKFRSMNLMGSTCPSNAKRFEFDADNLDLYLLAYAKQHDIPVEDVNTYDISKLVMPRLDTKDPWKWKKGYRDYKNSWTDQWEMICCIYRRRQTLTGRDDCFDVSTWTRAERERAHFEKIDPLPNNVLEILQQGLVLNLDDFSVS